MEELACARHWGNSDERQSLPWRSLLATVKVRENYESVLEEPCHRTCDLLWKHKEGHTIRFGGGEVRGCDIEAKT